MIALCEFHLAFGLSGLKLNAAVCELLFAIGDLLLSLVELLLSIVDFLSRLTMQIFESRVCQISCHINDALLQFGRCLLVVVAEGCQASQAVANHIDYRISVLERRSVERLCGHPRQQVD